MGKYGVLLLSVLNIKKKRLYLSELADAGVTELEHSCAFRSSFGESFQTSPS